MGTRRREVIVHILGGGILVALAAVRCSSGNAVQVQQDAAPGQDAVSAFCGNGQLDVGEDCDDGNLLAGDGCSPTCTNEVCDAATCFTGCCNAVGECVTGVDDTACGTGGIACGNCAATQAICYQQDCVPADCTPGDTLDCGLCGERECEAAGAWGACANEGVCLPDSIDVVGSCGNCGQLVRTCGQSCTYGPETCVGEGVCAAGTVETGPACVNCGHEERECNPQCLWDPWDCVGQGTCGGTGESCCDNACTDTDTDPDHCGGCNSPCNTGESCCGGGCLDTTSDDDNCGSCGHGCNAGEQCCSSSCAAYECITGGVALFAENSDGTWPADPVCTGGRYTVGTLTERHYGQFLRKYTLCVDGAQAGTITTCTGDVGVCSPAACPAGTAEVGLYIDRNSGGAIPEQQRICVGPASAGEFKECTYPIGGTACAAPACDAADEDLGSVREVDVSAGTILQIRLCVTPICPPACP